ncbi:Putative DnaJ domain, Chaperone J-domain superfamily [Colletotrichum destructivum]|uniref:DnaJ domain, Chaperone J-domain superfamily n=1 Tax=Colletotrichum destructivum TaxID=34406 RepID=A0AAX4J374_9PEZI|nr:Putative DnaJ domain, Chaperone J-domain superfamily [Colletotrichum destructivum]
MSSLPPDPYKALGVSKDAQLSEIRSAHRKLILKCHPDKVQDPTLKAQKQDEFQKVQQAYELLSDDNERAKYDDNVKLAELRKEMAKGMSANTSAPRAPRTYEVRTAEPRPDTFTKTTYRPSPGTKMYSQYNSRSWDEEIHSRSNSIFEEPRARRATSYEKPSRDRQDDDIRERERERRRREDRDRDREREELARVADRREREKEKERQADKKVAERAAKRAAEEKEARRQERKRQEKADKEREKERRRDAEEKSRRQKPVYMEPFDDEPTYIAKPDKKKSSSSSTTKEKKDDKRSRSIPRDGVPLRDDLSVPPVPLQPPDHKTKMTGAMLFAATYMDQSRKTGAINPHPGLNRSQTHDVRYAPPAPTPPAAALYVVPPPPIPAEEDSSRRSKSRRSSETKTREKSSHKKSSPTKEPPMAVPPSPNVVDASPSSRHMPPQFVSSASSPISTSPPKAPLRSATFNDGSYSRPPPSIVRAQTFSHVPADPELRSSGRDRSRMQPQTLSEDSESDGDRRPHRSHRYRTRSPDPVPTDYGQRTRYSVSGGRTVPISAESVYPPMYHEESSPSSRKHSKTAYYERPSMPSREASYTNSAYFPKVKTSRYDPVQYSDIPYRCRDEYNVGYA